MRFKSSKVGGYRVHAVSGTNTVSFGIDYRDANTQGLLGFAVEREDPTENERYFMFGFKVFESVVGDIASDQAVKTYDQPVQSFVWDDFTAKPGREYTYWFHPLKGQPKNLDRSAPPIRITLRTEPLFTTSGHDVFFNRGVASSQAYVREFGNQRPDAITDPAKRAKALQWLSRDLDEAMLAFIDGAAAGDTLLGCFYEFRYLPVLERLKTAIDRGVTVKLVLDGKDNSRTDNQGVFHEAFPREENLRSLAAAQLPASAVACWREANANDIQHNKFMVRLSGPAGTPREVWTGSTNLSMGGVHGQTNVGHWVRDGAVATAFVAYWDVVAQDAGSRRGMDSTTSRREKKAYRDAVGALLPTPTDWRTIASGTTPIFSPRSGSGVLDMYFAMVDESDQLSCITLAFGVNAGLKALLLNNASHPERLTFLLLEKEDKAKPNKPFQPLRARHNVYAAWGSYIRDAVYRWARETSTRALGLNQHVAYIHSKFLLKDPLGAEPIVVTGSANFSDASTNGNDENMLVIKGERRVADIYFTEFNRLFFHYYFRSMHNLPTTGVGGTTPPSRFLKEDDSWIAAYRPGSLKAKRVGLFTAMAGAELI